MPTYHFECEQCKTQFEMDAPMGSKDRPPCIKCNSKRVRKLIKPPMVHFKGTGFYKNDSRPPSTATPTKPVDPPKPATPPPTAPTASPPPAKHA